MFGIKSLRIHQILNDFTDILPKKKGIEKSLWVKKFIKRIDYSKEEITLLLYYKWVQGANPKISASDLAGENPGRNLKMSNSKKNLGTLDFGLKNDKWLAREDSNHK